MQKILGYWARVIFLTGNKIFRFGLWVKVLGQGPVA